MICNLPRRSFQTSLSGKSLLGLLLLIGLGSCQAEVPPAAAPETAQIAAPSCVEDYDPDRNYFPEQIDIDYAKGFSVTYHNHYKVVTVPQPWKNADTPFQYVLVQCGTPIPSGFDQAQIVEVPVSEVVTLSTTHLPHFEQLEAVDTLVGVGQFQLVNAPSVRQRIDQGQLQQFNSGNTLNLEKLVAAAPDLVMAFAVGEDARDRLPRLMQAGIPVAMVVEYLEPTPLGQAEWLKFTALFLNREAEAEATFAAIATNYEALAQRTADLSDQPTVFTGASYDGTWHVPGGQSFVAQLLADAGADYLWADVEERGSLPLDFEAVYAQAAAADFWINVSPEWRRYGDAIAADPRYGEFAALQNRQVFNNTAQLNAQGSNDYWESGVVNPDRVLADLIAIFHPDLLPDHDLIYYEPLQP